MLAAVPRLSEIVSATPSTRDRYVDFLRAFSIVTVVAGHWFIALIHWEEQRIFVHNAVGHQSGLWLATWFLQVMPLFFFVGGFSNLVGWNSVVRDGGGYSTYIQRRLVRLLRPTLVFALAWALIEVALHLAGVGAAGVLRGTFLPFGPLWFLAVYMVVAMLAPAFIALHRRFGLLVPVSLAAAVLLVDVARFGLAGRSIGWLNLGLVWLAVHQAGFFYADGTLVKAGRKAHLAFVATGLIVLLVLTNLELFFDQLWYPRSMVGVDIEPISNMSPPSLAIVALAVWQIGAAMLLRDRINNWLTKPRPWTGVVIINSTIMTPFLWHMTAFVVVVVLLFPLGLGNETEPNASWWVQRPIWLLAPSVALASLLLIFRRFERGTR